MDHPTLHNSTSSQGLQQAFPYFSLPSADYPVLNARNKIKRQPSFKQENSSISPVLSLSGATVMTSFLPIPAYTKSWSGLQQSKALAWMKGTELSPETTSMVFFKFF